MKHYRTTSKRPEISADDAKNRTDFNHLLELHRLNLKIGKNTKWISIGIPAILTLVVLSYLGIRNELLELSNRGQLVKEQEFTDIIPNDSPVEITSEIDVHTEHVPIPNHAQKPVDEIIPEAPSIKSEVFNDQPKEELSAYVEAVPIEGFPALYNYFDENLVYPSEILDEKIEGNVLIKFTIDTSGLAAKIVIEKSLHQKLDSAAVAIVNKMPLWKPAMLNGQPIPSTHRIPLFFHIEQTIE